MPWWAWLLVAWCVAAPVVSFAIGRGIRVADHAASPESASPAPKVRSGRMTAGVMRPDGSDATSGQYGGIR